jgi:arsenate reductase
VIWIAADVFEAYSAGTEIKLEINRDAVETTKELYDVDMSKTQRSKLLSEIPPVDCGGYGLQCQLSLSALQISGRWGMDDPTGKDKSEFIRIARAIDRR